MTLWVVRAGKHGEQQDAALQMNVVCHAWNGLPDYSSCKTKGELRQLYKKIFTGQSNKQITNGVSQVWRFAREIKVGDIVALPLKTESSVTFGRVTGEYTYQALAPNVIHTRPVQWIKSIPRSAIDKDILFSLGSTLTVFQVARNDASNRVSKILGLQISVPLGSKTPPTVTSSTTDDDDSDGADIDIESQARDQIIKFIEAKFKGHDLARVVDAVLRSQGYKTIVSPPGPDGGVDILAGSGSLGFESPRLCIQVKSGAEQVGHATLNELLGVVSSHSAHQGLLVSWSGFKSTVKKEAKKNYFSVRLWDQGDLVEAFLSNYERLDDEMRAELPLKRVWILVDEEAD